MESTVTKVKRNPVVLETNEIAARHELMALINDLFFRLSLLSSDP
jgi:hypothetical protein